MSPQENVAKDTPAAAPASSGSILHIRTLAEDLKRAQESGTQTAPTPPPPPPPAAEKSKAEQLQEELERHAAPIKEVRESIHDTPLSQTPQAREDMLDIRKAAATATGEEGTIIQDRVAARSPVREEITRGLTQWWTHTVVPLFTTTGPTAEIRMEVAPLAQEPVWTTAPTHVPAVHTLATDAQEVAEGVRPAVPPPPPSTWKRISEPRADTPVAHTDDELAAYRAQLRTLPPRPTQTERKPLKTVRSLRPPISASGDFIAKDTAAAVAPQESQEARERLARLKQPAPVEEPKVKREIPFIPPAPVREELSTPIRTYRNDALTDVKSQQLSRERIAAAEAVRRDRGLPTMPRKERAAADDTHGLTRVLLRVAGAIVVLGVLVGGGAFVYTRLETATPDEAVVAGVPSFFLAQLQIPITFTEDRIALLQDLNTARSSASLKTGEFAHIYASKGADAAPTREVMRVLDPRAPGAFIRGLGDTLMFGAYGANHEPFLILKTQSPETGIAGMRAWEAYMSIDLAPYFGAPVRRSFDPQALTTDQTRAAFFADTVILNKDGRILYDEYGAERIVYLFSGDRIVIARDRSTIEAVLRALE